MDFEDVSLFCLAEWRVQSAEQRERTMRKGNFFECGVLTKSHSQSYQSSFCA